MVSQSFSTSTEALADSETTLLGGGRVWADAAWQAAQAHADNNKVRSARMVSLLECRWDASGLHKGTAVAGRRG